MSSTSEFVELRSAAVRSSSEVVVDALIVVVNSDRQHALSLVLTDDILVELLLHLLGRQKRDRFRYAIGMLVELLAANIHAVVADINVDGRRGYKVLDLGFGLAAERTARLGICSRLLCH